MAILSKIRERSLFLILVIGLALFAFVLDPSKISDFFNASKVNEIGSVNGEGITREEYAKQIDAYKTQTKNRFSEIQSGKNVWNNLVGEKIYTQQLENAGISIGEEDVWNEIKKSEFVKGNAMFETAGVFDESKLKQYLADIKVNNPTLWNSWTSYMDFIRKNLSTNVYNNLVNVGIGATLNEGKQNYYSEQVKYNAKYVFLPYNSIADSLVNVSENDIKSYLNKHAKDYQVEASRDVAFVKFDLRPSIEDLNATKKQVADLIDDKEEYSTVTKGNITIKGFKNTDDVKLFFDENKSDTPLNDNYVYMNQVPRMISKSVSEGKVGDVFGPYKFGDDYKIAKITEVAMLPDSVKASHILVPFAGSRRATKETKETMEQAKKTADSLLAIVKKNPSKFADIANSFSKKSSNNNPNGGKLGWFTYRDMAPKFRDFCFENKKGSMGVVRTNYGFHVIKIENQKNVQKVVKLAEFGRRAEASEATENSIFQKAEEFAQKVSESKEDYYKIAKESGLRANSAVGLKALDEQVSTLGNERQIVTWAFNNDNKVGDVKRFDVKNGYAVAIITGKQEKGLIKAKKASADIKKKLIQEKKAALLSAKMNGSTLADIAKESNTRVKSANGITLKSSVLSSVGTEPNVVGAMSNATVDKVYSKIVGNNGVFAFKVYGVQKAVELPNYNTERTKISDRLRRNIGAKMYEAIKKSSEIEDNRAAFYGIQ